MNCALRLQPLLSGDKQKDVEWMLIQRVVFFADQKAFAELTQPYQSGLKRMLTRFKFLDVGAIEDLVQDTFLRVYFSLAGFNAQSRFSTWMYRIAYNLAIDYSRKKVISKCELEFAENVAEYPLMNWELKNDLQIAMNQLTEQQKIAVDLCLSQGYSHLEASKKMGLPLGTVKTHVLRARKILQRELIHWCVAA